MESTGIVSHTNGGRTRYPNSTLRESPSHNWLPRGQPRHVVYPEAVLVMRRSSRRRCGRAQVVPWSTCPPARKAAGKERSAEMSGSTTGTKRNQVYVTHAFTGNPLYTPRRANQTQDFNQIEYPRSRFGICTYLRSTMFLICKPQLILWHVANVGISFDN